MSASQRRPTEDFERSLTCLQPITTSKDIACAAIVPDCGFTATAPTEEDLLKKVAAHAAHDHGITEVTPELLTAVKAAIQNR